MLDNKQGLKLGVEPSSKTGSKTLALPGLKKKFISASLSASHFSWGFCTASWMKHRAKKVEKLTHERLCHLSKITQEDTRIAESTLLRDAQASCLQLWTLVIHCLCCILGMHSDPGHLLSSTSSKFHTSTRSFYKPLHTLLGNLEVAVFKGEHIP